MYLPADLLHRLRNGTNSADNAVSRRPSAGSSWSPLCYSYSCRCILVLWPTIPGNAPRSVVRSRLQKIDGHPLMPCVEYPLHASCSTRFSTGQKNDARNAAEAFDLLTRVARVSSGREHIHGATSAPIVDMSILTCQSYVSILVLLTCQS